MKVFILFCIFLCSIAFEESKKEEENPKKIQGTINFDGETYKSICECTKADAIMEQCKGPVKIRVYQEQFNHAAKLGKQDIQELLGDAKQFTLLDADIDGLATIDGRDHKIVLGTPGGEFGEFIIALSTFEQFTNQSLSQEHVERFLMDWLTWSSRLYKYALAYYTDEIAIERFSKSIGNPLDLDLEVPDISFKQKTTLLHALQNPRNQGNHFLRAVMHNPDRFRIRLELVQYAIASFFRILWDFPNLASDKQIPVQKLRVVVFEGKRQNAQAWINFRGGQHCESEHKYPAFRPYSQGMSVLVNHPTASDGLRERLSTFFSHKNKDLSIDRFLHRLKRRGTSNMETMAQLLGSETPFFTVVVE